ncbi:hypothetical protein GW17_00020423 [Ensete ventricosum]|nr:hypothetical protein GW17_00020423 [Ensete ventricosum]
MIVLNNIAAGSESGKDGVMNYLLLPREDSNIPPLAPKFLHASLRVRAILEQCVDFENTREKSVSSAFGVVHTLRRNRLLLNLLRLECC